MIERSEFRLGVDVVNFDSAYAEFLAALWDDLDDLLETHYGPRVRLDDDRLRMKLVELRLRLLVVMDQTEPFLHDPRDSVATNVARLRAFGVELLRLLDFDLRDEQFDLSCGSSMVQAQNRILDEARRVAAAH